MKRTKERTHCGECLRPWATDENWTHKEGCECDQCINTCWDTLSIQCSAAAELTRREIFGLILKMDECREASPSSLAAIAAPAALADLAARIRGTMGGPCASS